MKIRFAQYQVRIKGRNHRILIPQHIEKLWLNGYEWKDFALVWNGDRRALEALLYSFAVLGVFDPDSILYFPIRTNLPAETYAGAEADPFDLILMNHQAQFPRRKWGQARRGLQKQKPQLYFLDYKEDEILLQFQKEVSSWKKTKAYDRKDAGMRDLRGASLFYVLSRRQFMQLYLECQDFLGRDLEGELQKREGMYGEIPFFAPEGTRAERYRYRSWTPKDEKRCPLFEIGYYDRRYDRFYKEETESISY